MLLNQVSFRYRCVIEYRCRSRLPFFFFFFFFCSFANIAPEIVEQSLRSEYIPFYHIQPSNLLASLFPAVSDNNHLSKRSNPFIRSIHRLL